MKVLVADKLERAGVEELRAGGHDVILEPNASTSDLPGLLAKHDPQVLVVRSTRVTEEVLAAASALELVVRAGAGYDTIDVDAASDRGIFVSNCPGKNASAVAELVIGLIVALDRLIPDNVADARMGRWDKGRYSAGRGLKGRTLAVIGLGSIGRAVVRRALGLEMRVVAWSRSLTDELAVELGIIRAADPISAAREADVVTLHVAGTPETHRLADRPFFEALRNGAYFVNTSRGEVVDSEALAWALDAKAIRAAVDVFDGEPEAKDGALDWPLARHPGLYLTHHIGASTQQAQEETAREVVRIVEVYVSTGRVENCVNLADQSPATHMITVRHRDRVGVLASVLDLIREAEWNVQEMENLIFEGATAACARIRFDGSPRDDVIDRLRQLPDVLAVSVIALQE